MNILGFVGYTVSVVTTELGCCGARATLDNIEMNDYSNKTWLMDITV